MAATHITASHTQNTQKSKFHHFEKKELTMAATPSGSLTVINCFPDSKLKSKLKLNGFEYNYAFDSKRGLN